MNSNFPFGRSNVNFDKRFQQMNKQFESRERLVKGSIVAVFGLWAVGALLSLAVTGGLIYAAIHFLTKFW